MSARSDETPPQAVPVEQPHIVWERPEPRPRPAPAPLSRESIVHAAMAIADRDGLAAVSLRKVAAALDAGPMRIYGYLSSKEELLEVMVDAVYGEMVAAAPIAGEWRDALRTIAQRTHEAATAHPWFIDLLSGRPHLGPNALAHHEASLAALSAVPEFADIDAAVRAIWTVNAYVIGAIRNEANELRAERQSGLDKAAWQQSEGPYIRRMIASGRFPALARMVQEATHPSPDARFDQGLEIVLDGLAGRTSHGR